ncbi:hypothetical protein [Rhizobium terrae]|uniref:hypothetical protein n=1 Tax=Rhizobium terrae TaxID=2171756 RepID=UPI000E3B5DBE|nr:hypothetical protein [Rhizobium terrae]
MNARNALIALGSAIAGGLVVALLMHPAGPTVTAKSDRLSGPPAETAFLPERFGVPASTQ